MRDGPETVSRYKSVTDTKPKLTCQVPGLAALLPTCHPNVSIKKLSSFFPGNPEAINTQSRRNFMNN